MRYCPTLPKLEKKRKRKENINVNIDLAMVASQWFSIVQKGSL